MSATPSPMHRVDASTKLNITFTAVEFRDLLNIVIQFCERGALRAHEASSYGAVHDKLQSDLDKIMAEKQQKI